MPAVRWVGNAEGANPRSRARKGTRRLCDHRPSQHRPRTLSKALRRSVASTVTAGMSSSTSKALRRLSEPKFVKSGKRRPRLSERRACASSTCVSDRAQQVAAGALTKNAVAFRLGLGRESVRGQQYMSWIALDDVEVRNRVGRYARGNERTGEPRSPQPVTNREFTRALGRASAPSHKSSHFRRFVARAALGEMARELLWPVRASRPPAWRRPASRSTSQNPEAAPPRAGERPSPGFGSPPQLGEKDWGWIRAAGGRPPRKAGRPKRSAGGLKWPGDAAMLEKSWFSQPFFRACGDRFSFARGVSSSARSIA